MVFLAICAAGFAVIAFGISGLLWVDGIETGQLTSAQAASWAATLDSLDGPAFWTVVLSLLAAVLTFGWWSGPVLSPYGTFPFPRRLDALRKELPAGPLARSAMFLQAGGLVLFLAVFAMRFRTIPLDNGTGSLGAWSKVAWATVAAGVLVTTGALLMLGAIWFISRRLEAARSAH